MTDTTRKNIKLKAAIKRTIAMPLWSRERPLTGRKNLHETQSEFESRGCK